MKLAKRLTDGSRSAKVTGHRSKPRGKGQKYPGKLGYGFSGLAKAVAIKMAARARDMCNNSRVLIRSVPTNLIFCTNLVKCCLVTTFRFLKSD